jgi:hypothetical protein
MQLLTSPLYFCSKACKLHFLLEIPIMIKGTTFYGFVPIMSEPDHSSQMISQLLFGEEFLLLEQNGAWCAISLDYDGTEGWVLKDVVKLRTVEDGEKKGENEPVRVASLPVTTILDLTLGRQRIIPAGSIWNSRHRNSISWYGHDFELISSEGFVTPGANARLLEIGKRIVSLPSIPGGRSGFGFDGPGLVQMLCRMMGKKIPRSCVQQAELGITINFMHEVEEGDLAFFDNEENEIVHVGMILQDHYILHSSGCVSIDYLDHHGIYSSEKERYTHKLRVIKRI